MHWNVIWSGRANQMHSTSQVVYTRFILCYTLYWICTYQFTQYQWQTSGNMAKRIIQIHQGWGLLSKIYVKFRVNQQWFSNMAAVLPANQTPGLKIFVK